MGYADFASANLQYLAEFVDLRCGAPSHDCFSRLFRLIDPAQMERVLQVFAQTMRRALGLEPISKVIVCDGKRMKRGYERGRSFMPPLMISVWDTETRLSIAARASSDGNEVAATLEVLQTLVLEGSWVLADALHCHPRMAADIRAGGGNYALKLKGNNAPLFGCANRAFAKAEAKGELTFHMTEEKGHDRLERRLASVVMAPADAPNFPGLVMFGRIESERQVADKKPSFYTHYVALSEAMTPKTMLNLVRSYWGVENNCHWQLDVAFDEDGCRTRKDNGAKNLSVIRRIGLDILRAHPVDMSIQRKMQLAAWNVDFRDELYTHMR